MFQIRELNCKIDNLALIVSGEKTFEVLPDTMPAHKDEYILFKEHREVSIWDGKKSEMKDLYGKSWALAKVLHVSIVNNKPLPTYRIAGIKVLDYYYETNTVYL